MQKRVSWELYASRLFRGRINRRAYVAGMINLMLTCTVIVLVLSMFITLFSNPKFALLIFLPVIAIYLLYASSLTVRRLHDINVTGLLVALVFPGFIYTLINLWGFLIPLSGSNIPTLESLLSSNVPLITYLINAARICAFANILLFAVPGTPGVNNYGTLSTHRKMREIFGFAKPASHAGEPTEVNPLPAPSDSFIKTQLKILLGLVLFFVAFVGIVLLFAFTRRTF